jgi:hypothetical protein
VAKSHYIDDFRFNVARGLVVNTSVRNIFGTTGDNANIVTGEFRTPWEDASNYTFPSSALTMDVVSSAVGDTAVTILIIGLNADYEIIQETLTLNGTTTVTTTNQYYRINDVITTVGNALGDVTVSNGGTTYAKILAGTGRNQAAIYTVPKGHCFYLERIDAFCTDANGGKAARFRNFVENSAGRDLRVADTTFFENMNIVRRLPFKYGEKTDIALQLRSLSGSVFGSIFAEGLLVEE